MTNPLSRILVWDAPVRVFHWLMVLCFAGAYLSSENHSLVGVHVTLGYTMIGLVAFRVVWGVLGTRHARFDSFVRGPRAVFDYASTLLDAKAKHPVGHNPLGALSILLLLSLTCVMVCTGWMVLTGGSHNIKELHEGCAALMLAVVGLHVIGVIFASMMQRENLVGAMISGRKQGAPSDAIAWNWWPVAVLLLVGVLGFWWLQWQGDPVRTPEARGQDSVRGSTLIPRMYKHGDQHGGGDD